MAKMRISELAKELGISSKEALAILADNGIEGKTHSSNIEDDAIAIIRAAAGKGGAAPKKDEKKAEAPEKKSVKAPAKAEEKPAKEKAQKADDKPAKTKPAASENPPKKEGGAPERRPAPADASGKTKTKHVVINRHLTSNGRGNAPADGRRPVRPRPDADRRPGMGRPAGGPHTPIKPRTEMTRIRPSDRNPAAVEEPEKTQASSSVPENTAAPVETPVENHPVEKAQQTEKKTGTTHISIRRNIYEGRGNTPASANRNPANASRGQGSGRFSGQGQGQSGRPDRSQGSNAAPVSDGQSSRPGAAKGGRDRDKKRHEKEHDQVGKRQEQFRNLEKVEKKKKPKAPSKPVRDENEILTLTLPERLTIKELADKMLVQPSDIVKKLFMKGTMVTVNQSIDYEQAEEIALEFNCVCEPEEKVDVIAELLKEEEEDAKDLIARPPVVCVMGHVDHGKTSLLDAIRDTHVTDREAGGITQKIGAYVVSINNQKITFLDTPGHEAFTAMRMRGANSTDIAILVVAADDGVMPQTVEAINHAKAAGVEIIVAINKIDKPNANVDRVKQELSEYELVPEDWGGSTVFVPVSAHTHEGIDNLLEMILLTAEVLELRANPKRNARGLVLEAELDKGRGVVATVLVQKGTLNVGDPVAAGSSYGKVRAMIDENGRRLKKAGPSTPVEILGLSEVPNAGEIFMSMDSEKEARSVAETFISVGKDKLIEDSRMKMSLDDLFSQIQAGNLKELNIIVKADVQGSVEAVKTSLEKLSNEEVVVKVIHGGVGAINESDVVLASASNAIIIGFNVRPDNVAKQTADQEGVDIRLYKVIYNAIEDVEAAMKGMLEPVYEEKILGHAIVRQIFKSSDVGNIAGSYITDGIFQRDCKVRIRREGEQIFEGTLASLKRFKDDVKEVKTGFECGLVVDGFGDYAEDDEIEAYTMVEVPR